MTHASVKRWILILFLVAGAVRVGWVVACYGGEGGEGVENVEGRGERLVYPDEEAYWQVARSLVAGDGLVDEFGYRATYMPGYPAFLALFAGLGRPLFWARVVQAILAAWVAPATFLLAGRWVELARAEGAGRSDIHKLAASPFPSPFPSPFRLPFRLQHVAVLAGLAAAFDPFLIFFSGLLLTEALFAAVLVTAWMLVLRLSDRSRAGWVKSDVGMMVATGMLFLLCVMLRPSAIVLMLAASLAMVICRRFDRWGITAAVVLVGVVFVGLLPWAIRNERVTGQWRLLTTRGGISLYDGLREGATGDSDLAHTKTLPEVAGLREIEWDRYFRRQAWSAAQADPMRVIRLGWRKLLRTWSLTPNVATHRHGAPAVVSAVWMVGILALAAVGWWFSRWAVAAWVMLLLPVVSFTLLHTVFVGSVRYRVSIMPMVMVLSASGIVRLVGRIRSRQDGGDP